MEKELYVEKVVYKALEDLDERLYRMGVKPFSLNVCGGFALLLENVRMSDYTDVDYVGKTLPEPVRQVVDEIGLEWHLGRGWVNNDVCMSGFGLDELELSVGKLNFVHRFDLRVISVYSLDKLGLLRMKMVALDTSYSEVASGGDFARSKDFKDVQLLMEAIGCEYEDVVEDTFDYMMYPEVFYLLRYYLKTGDMGLKSGKKCLEIVKTTAHAFSSLSHIFVS